MQPMGTKMINILPDETVLSLEDGKYLVFISTYTCGGAFSEQYIIPVEVIDSNGNDSVSELVYRYFNLLPYGQPYRWKLDSMIRMRS